MTPVKFRYVLLYSAFLGGLAAWADFIDGTVFANWGFWETLCQLWLIFVIVFLEGRGAI